MMAKAILTIMLLLGAPVMAQQPAAQSPQGDPFEQLTLRVASLRANGQCVVDRGKRDHLRVDDRVILSPRGGP